MKRVMVIVTLALLFFVMPLGVGYAAPAKTQDQLLPPVATKIGTFGGIAYVQYDGIFTGATSTGTFRVPYRLTAPAKPSLSNRTVIVEPPHSAASLGTLNASLGKDFLLSRGFEHAGIGWSTASGGPGFDNRILDPSVPGVYINGGFVDYNGHTDDEIIVDFARALVSDPVAQKYLGRVDYRYLTGFSETADTDLRVLNAGWAKGVFDLVFPYTATTSPNGWDGPNPQLTIPDGRFTGKLMIVNSEDEGASIPLVDLGLTPLQYRFYAVAGTPHVSDFLVPDIGNMTTPASIQPELRAHFMQAHEWVTGGSQPPLSTHLSASADGKLDRDARGNAISVNALGQPTPRLPFVELGEAHYVVTGFLGKYDSVKSVTALHFASFDEYLNAFGQKLDDYAKAGNILPADVDAMLSRAALCSSLTYTQVYRDYYDNFVTITPCGQ